MIPNYKKIVVKQREQWNLNNLIEQQRLEMQESQPQAQIPSRFLSDPLEEEKQSPPK